MTSNTLEHTAKECAVVILAAGKGSRMASNTPKPLHKVAGRTMLGHVLHTARSLNATRNVVIVGHGAGEVEAAAQAFSPNVSAATQEPQLGTGHAVMQAKAALEGFAGDVFVLYADTPLVRPETLRRLSEARAGGAGVAVLGFEAAAPGGYGRLIVNETGALERIVEAKDASAEELQVTLCNSGVMCVDGARLFKWLDQITDDNAKREYYLTDLVEIARRAGARCAVAQCSEDEVLGVNSRAELAAAEAAFQRRARLEAMAGGATLLAPETVFFSHDTQLGRDVVIGPNVVFGPGVQIADDVEIKAFCHLEGARVASAAVIGPYARLRPGARIEAAAHVGNFVEIKNAVLGEGAKANHLSYLGDADIGARANVGAGTITCNYDGVLKHRTQVGPGAFIGSNSALVAPVAIGAGATVAAGSAVTQDVPPDALAIARGRQVDKTGAAAALRARLQAAKRAKEQKN